MVRVTIQQIPYGILDLKKKIKRKIRQLAFTLNQSVFFLFWKRKIRKTNSNSKNQPLYHFFTAIIYQPITTHKKYVISLFRHNSSTSNKPLNIHKNQAIFFLFPSLSAISLSRHKPSTTIKPPNINPKQTLDLEGTLFQYSIHHC